MPECISSFAPKVFKKVKVSLSFRHDVIQKLFLACVSFFNIAPAKKTNKACQDADNDESQLALRGLEDTLEKLRQVSLVPIYYE